MSDVLCVGTNRGTALMNDPSVAVAVEVPVAVEAQPEGVQQQVGAAALDLVVVPSLESLALPKPRGYSANEKRRSAKAWHKSTRHRRMVMCSSHQHPRLPSVNWALSHAQRTMQSRVGKAAF
jgi:hypothetical protein